MREVTYLIYIIFWESMVFGGIGFAVFVLDRSGWWLLVAATLSMMAYSPASWIHGQTSTFGNQTTRLRPEPEQ